jgi:hypothetical protein
MVVWMPTFIMYCRSNDWKLSIEKACSHVSIYSDRHVSGVCSTVGVQKEKENATMILYGGIIIEQEVGEELEQNFPSLMGN